MDGSRNRKYTDSPKITEIHRLVIYNPSYAESEWTQYIKQKYFFLTHTYTMLAPADDLHGNAQLSNGSYSRVMHGLEKSQQKTNISHQL